jgi:para-aminobenzoate synthetase component I
MPIPRAKSHTLALHLDPAEVVRRLPSTEGLAWLDSSVAQKNETWSYVGTAPQKILRGNIDRDWAMIENAVTSGQEHHAGSDPFTSGLIGWVGFDGNFCFGVYPQILAFHHQSRHWWGHAEPELISAEAIPKAAHSYHNLDFKSQTPRAEFIRAVEHAQSYIAAGDVYQVNLAYPWLAAWPSDASALGYYERLRRVSPAPYAAFLDIGDTRIISSSPECFLRMAASTITTRPIKGTRPRFPLDTTRDAQSRAELMRSAKEQAELLMITDLERNDLGQVCEYGSVHVTELASVETFAQVFHLISTVTGKLRSDVDHAAAFRACFPGGSISGAPKKRALEIIAELEQHPRGCYTGAIGYFGFNGQSQFNIAIRTAIQKGDSIHFHVGAGIVADSVPAREYEETLHKAAGLLAAAR